MKNNFEHCLKVTLVWEGGYVNHPDDPGGMTNLGVTAAVYGAYTGKPVTEAIMRAITVEDVEPIYKELYWDKVRGDDLPAGIDLCVFDFGINSGPSRAIRYLQRLVGVEQDGVLGPVSLKAVKHFANKDTEKMIDAYTDLRSDFVKNLKHFKTFGRGWLRRIGDIRYQAMLMTLEN